MSDKTELDLDAERASFEVWARDECRMPPDAPLNWNAVWTKAAWDGYLAARRATIQPPAAEPAPAAPADAVRDARDLALERAAWMLDSYEKHLYDLTPINIEEHPYIPSISEAASELRALKSTPKEPA